ncbi:MAG: hypothetical protein IKR00_00220, partial [Lachnospiraceae bacterium]|nr:hypothetical protein [Lachnospiraceae bacterium]
MKKSFRSTAGVLMALCLLTSALSGSAAAFGAGTDIEINTEKGIISDYLECGTDAYGQETEGNAEVQIGAAEAFEVSDGTEANSGISENSTYDAEADGSIAETGSFSELNEAGKADEGITESGSGSEINGNGTSETDGTGNNNGTAETEVGTDPAEAGDSNTDNDSEKTGEDTADGSVVPGQADEEKLREQETEDGSSGDSGAGNDTSADAKDSSKGLNNASDAVDEKATVREGQKWLAVRKVGNGSVYIDSTFAEKIEPKDKRYPSGLPGAAVFLEETVRENMQQPDDEVITDDLLNIEAVQNTEAV